MLLFTIELLVFIQSDVHSSFNLKQSLNGIGKVSNVFVSFSKDKDNNDYKAYYKLNNGALIEITGTSGKSFTPPCTLSFFYTTQLCLEAKEIVEKRLELEEGDSAKNVHIGLNDVSYDCLHKKKNYYVNIKNGLSEEFSSKLYVTTRTGETVEVPKNEPYTDSLEDYNPFSIKVWIETQYCEKTQVGTVTAKETQDETVIDDSKRPDSCLPYSVCIKIELPSSYTIHYKSTSETGDEYKPVEENSLTLYSENEFKVQLYLSGTPNCPDKYEWKAFSASKKIQCQTLTPNDIPPNCLPQYKICFDVSQLPNDVKLGYTIDKEDESKMKELTATTLSSPNSFAVKLYLMKSPLCTKPNYIGTYSASLTSSDCVILKKENLPLECLKKYYIKIVSKVKYPYSIFIKEKDELEYVESTYVKEVISQADFPIYVKTDACKTGELIKNIKPTTDPEEFWAITNADIPKKCFTYKICGDLSKLSNDYEISYTISYEEGTPIHKMEHGPLSYTYQEPFTINYNLTKSPHCAENEVTGTLVATEPYGCFDHYNFLIPAKCKTGIDYTPVPTGIPTMAYEKETVETYLNADSNTNLKDSLDKKFQELNKDSSNKDKIKIVNIVGKSITFDYQLKEDELINLVEFGANILYKGGNLRVPSRITNIKLIGSRQINLQIYQTKYSGSSDYKYVNLELADADKDQPEVDVTINFLSRITSNVELKVPENVKNVKIGSLDFGNIFSCLSIKPNDDNYGAVHAEINSITVKDDSQPIIQNMLIHDSIAIEQGAKISLSDVEFKENAKIKYNVHYFDNYVWDSIIRVDGTIGIPGKIEIALLNDKIKPVPNWHYTLIGGEMDMSTCQSLAEVVDIENTGFTSKTCKSYGRSLSESYGLVLSLDDDSGNKSNGPNLGLIIGVVVGVVVVIAIVIVVVVIVIKKRKNRNSESQGEDNNADTNDI